VSPKRPRLTATEAEKLLLGAGFVLARSKGAHRIYVRSSERLVIPFHAGEVLHPKIVKEVLAAIGDEE
jgi:predicted RNA binding protein YcfA (HicA-like mRNA interferase family)